MITHFLFVCRYCCPSRLLSSLYVKQTKTWSRIILFRFLIYYQYMVSISTKGFTLKLSEPASCSKISYPLQMLQRTLSTSKGCFTDQLLRKNRKYSNCMISSRLTLKWWPCTSLVQLCPIFELLLFCYQPVYSCKQIISIIIITSEKTRLGRILEYFHPIWGVHPTVTAAV